LVEDEFVSIFKLYSSTIEVIVYNKKIITYFYYWSSRARGGDLQKEKEFL